MSETDIDDDGVESDRRRDNRTTAVYRPVLLETEGFQGFCLLRNLSTSGLMGIAYAQFAEGEAVSVQFMPGHVVSGTIVWSREGRIGVEFDEEIDLVASLKNMGSTFIENGLNRGPRLQIDCEGEAILGNARWKIRVQDISQKGIKTVLPSVRPGDELVIALPGLEPRKAIVRWSQNNIAGLNFVRPIAFEELARWVIDLQAGLDRSNRIAAGPAA